MVYIKYILFFCAVFVWSHTSSFAQTIKISGSVHDATTQNKIDYATIAIINVVDSVYIDYKYTDDLGQFSLEIAATVDTIILNISKFGYENLQDTLWGEKRHTPTKYFLNVSPFVLNEIIINDKAPKAISKNDTTVIDAKKFATGEERKMEDILKKLPGIEVDAQGKIKYKNKPITKVLIEGDNLLGSNYTLGTKNISSEVVDKVEIIDNFIINPLLKGILESDEMVINIKVDEKFKHDLSGSMEVGLGKDSTDIRYLGNIYLFSLMKKTKSILIHNTNNIRQNVGDIHSYDYDQKMVEYIKYVQNDFYNAQPYLQSVNTQGSYYIDDAFINSGTRSISRVSIIQPISKSIKINGSANVFYNNTVNSENENTLYFQGTDTLHFFNSLKNVSKGLSHKYDLGSEYLNLTKGWSFNTKSILCLNELSGSSQLSRNALYLSQNNRNNNYCLINSIDIFKKLGTYLLEFYADSKSKKSLETSIYNNPFFNLEFDQKTLIQDVRMNHSNFISFIKLLNRKDINYDLTVGYQNSGRKINSALKNSHMANLGSSVANDIERKDNDIFFEAYHYNKIKNWVYNLKSTLFYSILEENKTSRHFTKTFNIGSQLELPRWWRIICNLHYSEKLTNFDKSLINPILIDFQTKYYGDPMVQKPINRSVNLSVSKKNDYKGYYFHFYSSYSSTIRDYGSQFNFDTTYIFNKTLIYPAETQHFLMNSKFSLTLDNINSKFSFSASYNFFEGKNAVNQMERTYIINGYNFVADYFLTVKYFNINIHYSIDKSNFSLKLMDNNFLNTTQKFQVNPVLKLGKKWIIKGLLTNYRYENSDNTNHFWTTQFSWDYKLEYKSISSFNFTMMNPLNTKKYDLNFVSDYSIQNITFLGTQRFFYLSCTFNL